MSRSRDGCIKPAEIVGREHLFSYISLVDENMLPLASLSLVASDSIRILNLEGIIIDVLLYFFHAVALVSYLWVVLPNRLEELFLLRTG